MKKTMKKCLILALVVMSVVAMAFCVSATDTLVYRCSECKTFVPTITGEVIPATCEQAGYTEVICKPCDEAGRHTVLTKTDPKTALGHDTVEVYEKTTDGEGEFYKHIDECKRTVNGNACGYKAVKEENNRVVRYYKVTYINPFVTDTLDESIKYADIAATYKEVKLGEEYVRESSSAQKAPTPYRIADKDCGKYKFAGWKIGDKTYTKIEMPIASMNTADYEATADFAALTNVVHSITFYSEKGAKLEVIENIAHGATVDEYILKDITDYAPLKADNIEYKFTFDYWTLFDIIGAFDFSKPIYGDVEVKAHYMEYLKEYKLKYFDRHGKELGYDDVVTVAGFGDARKLADTGLAMKANPTTYGLESYYFDAAYEYIFTGNWLIEGRDNYVIEIEHITLPSDINDFAQTKDYIKVTPQYKKIARTYDLNVFVTYDDDLNYHPEEIDIQITDADGNPIGVSTLTKKDIVKGTENSRTPTYKKVFKVRYSSMYRVVATSKNYKGVATPTFIDGGNVFADYKPGGCNIYMTREAGEPCTCLCHGIFKPVWVGILNILYSLFKAEFVCCDDMFANIGDDLAYGPNKS